MTVRLERFVIFPSTGVVDEGQFTPPDLKKICRKEVNKMSHLTAEELAALRQTILSEYTPYIIQGASATQLSISRNSGGCRYQGREYLYVSPTDELIRDDVVKWLGDYRKDKRKQAKLDEKKKQLPLL